MIYPIINNLIDDTNIIKSYEERADLLSLKIKNVLSAPDLIENIYAQCKNIGINEINNTVIAYTAMEYLLCMIRPEEILPTLKEDLPEENQELLTKMAFNIKDVLFGGIQDEIKERWTDHDEDTQAMEEAFEIIDVPTPPQIGKPANSTVSIVTEYVPPEPAEIRPAAIITNEELVKKISEEKSTWDKKTDDIDTANTATVTSRDTVDTSLPKISLGSSDPYKESIE